MFKIFGLLLLAACGATPLTFASTPSPSPTMPSPPSTPQSSATAILAGGCFWCLQHDLNDLPGILNTEVGYAGGDRPNPTYETYHDLNETYKTPHIEVVAITYNPTQLSYAQLLNTFLRTIDPTDGGGQFCDRGPSYRPAIFAQNDAETVAAEHALKTAAATIGQPIKVDILPAATFWPAETYHQHYAEKNPARYNFYRWKCGRDARVKAVWGK
jgi:peptide-methionine (S)-S-oxide reductase